MGTRPLIPAKRSHRIAMALCYAIVFVPLGVAIAACLGAFA